MEQRKDYSVGSISKAILSLAVPMAAAQLVNILYSVVDRIYLGRLPGMGSLACFLTMYATVYRPLRRNREIEIFDMRSGVTYENDGH